MPCAGGGALTERAGRSGLEAAALTDHLVAVGRARDRTAFAVLFVHFAPRVKTYLLRLGLTETKAEELAQETMLTVWHKAALFDPCRAAASTWIFTVARNLRINALRRERSQIASAGEADSSLLSEQKAAGAAATTAADAAPGPEELLASAQREMLLRNTLRALPKEQARVLELAYFKGQSHAEISRELGIPLGTVKGRLRLALARLRAALEGENP